MKLFSASSATVSIVADGNTAAVLAALVDAQDKTEEPLFTAAGLLAFNGATLDMLRSEGNDRDAIAVATLGRLETLGYLHGFNATAWDRLASEGNDRDAITAVALGLLQVGGYLHGFNGTTWDRTRMLGTAALDGLGQLATSPAIPGASAVQTKFARPSAGTSRVTLFTPASGKRVRIITTQGFWESPSGNITAFYFGTGVAHTSDASKVISIFKPDEDTVQQFGETFPDGGGPVGAVDEVVSLIRASSATPGEYKITFREE